MGVDLLLVTEGGWRARMAAAFSCCCQSAIGVMRTILTVEKGIVENEAEGFIFLPAPQ